MKPDFWGKVAANREVHEAMINHLMRCSVCLAPQDRYCPAGRVLHRAYQEASKHE